MKKGKAPIGEDGNPMELHHPTGQNGEKPEVKTRTDHRGKGNFKRNHPWLFEED
jgi:hypothetical protein